MLHVLIILGFLISVYTLGVGCIYIFLLLSKQELKWSSHNHVLSFLFGWGVIYLISGISSLARLPFGVLLKSTMFVFLFPALLFFKEIKGAGKPLLTTGQKAYTVASFAVLIVAICTGLNSLVNLCDDPGRYFLLANKLWDSGNLYEPFNNWRTTVPGGALVVQSIGLKIIGSRGPIAIDVAASLIILYLLGIASRNWLAKSGLLLFSIFVALTNSAGIMPVNTVPRYLPVSLMIAGFLLLIDLPQAKMNATHIVVGISLAFSAVALIRIQNLLFIGLAMILYLSLTKFSNIKEFLIIGLVVLLNLLPWLLSSLRDTGSAIFPLMMGNVDEHWTGNALPLGISNPFVDRFLSIDGLKFLAISTLIVFLMRERTKRFPNADVLAFSIAAFVTVALFSYIAVANTALDISRYVAPIVVTTLLLFFLQSLDTRSDLLYRVKLSLLLMCIIAMGISSSSVGIKNVGEVLVNRLSATARMITSGNPTEVDFSESKESIDSLLKLIKKESVVLTAIDDSELALTKSNDVYSVAIPGFVYPKPHNMMWSNGLSPSSDLFSLKFEQTKLEIGFVYPLIEFGSSGAADMIGIRRTGIGIEFVLDHWGTKLLATRPWKLASKHVDFQIEIDRKRGLVRFSSLEMEEALSSPTGFFHSPSSNYQVAINGLNFSTVNSDLPPAVRIGLVQLSKNNDQFFAKLFSDLRKRGIDYLLLQNPEDSICLYNNQAWIKNATSRTLYEAQAPYFFAWFDLADRAKQQTLNTATEDEFNSAATIIDGNYLLVNLERIR